MNDHDYRPSDNLNVGFKNQNGKLSGRAPDLAEAIDPGDPVFFFLVGARGGGRKPRIVPKGAIDATTTEKFPVRVARGSIPRATGNI